MKTFQVRFHEGLGCQNWQVELDGQWTKPMTEYQLARALARTAAGRREAAPANPQWSKPIDHAVKRRKSPPLHETQGQWEIRGGKVQRIAATSAERSAQQLAELANLLDGLDDEEFLG